MMQNDKTERATAQIGQCRKASFIMPKKETKAGITATMPKIAMARRC